jgi:hypothetical protein
MPTDDPGSITRWIGALKAGELDAAQPLWERYFEPRPLGSPAPDIAPSTQGWHHRPDLDPPPDDPTVHQIGGEQRPGRTCQAGFMLPSVPTACENRVRSPQPNLTELGDLAWAPNHGVI